MRSPRAICSSPPAVGCAVWHVRGGGASTTNWSAEPRPSSPRCCRSRACAAWRRCSTDSPPNSPRPVPARPWRRFPYGDGPTCGRGPCCSPCRAPPPSRPSPRPPADCSRSGWTSRSMPPPSRRRCTPCSSRPTAGRRGWCGPVCPRRSRTRSSGRGCGSC